MTLFHIQGSKIQQVIFKLIILPLKGLKKKGYINSSRYFDPRKGVCIFLPPSKDEKTNYKVDFLII